MSSNMMRDSLIGGMLLAFVAVSAPAAPHETIPGQPGLPEGGIVVRMQGMAEMERTRPILKGGNRPPSLTHAPMPRTDLIIHTQNVEAARSALLNSFGHDAAISPAPKDATRKAVSPKAAAAL